MALKKLLQRFTTPVSELDLQRLREFAESLPGVTRIEHLEPRTLGTIVGEITGIRIVPRAGSPSLEATISDGTGAIVAVWTGRRRIPGVAPGKRLIVSGRGSPSGPGGRLLIFNPEYELL